MTNAFNPLFDRKLLLNTFYIFSEIINSDLIK